MSNVITTLGAATGSGNAITDISIDRNALTPAKNITFDNTEFDHSITGKKTFTSAIISNCIQYSGYDNSSVFLACAGVRSIADIQNASYSKSETYAKDEVYTKSEDDALLLLKADKTELINSYTKTEINYVLNNKSDTGVSYSKSESYARDEVYTKSEDDALLVLKADKTELIDSFTKTKTNNLLNNKADNGASYTKSEDDKLLFAKVEKTQLIDSYSKSETYARDEVYTKGETDNMLNSKTDTGVSYIKSDDDALLLLKANKSQLIDSYSKNTGVSYSKNEDDALLLLKADKSTTYTKTQDDALLLLKADKTQLIDSYTKGDTNNLLNNKTDTGVSYTKGEDDALLLLKADKSTTYTKTETDYIISQIDVGDVDLTDYYNKTKTDELLSEKADTTELSNYMTL
ncbi:MAG: hypothetical protein EZS28_036640, partial [Streblomastix strix]